MRLAVTADLHWGHHPRGDEATRELGRKVAELQPDAFAIAGDVGTGDEFAWCLEALQGVAPLCWVLPGNHDLWTDDASPASLELYEERLPRMAAECGYQYLDLQPYVDPSGRLAVLGSMNWYDYSFADPTLELEYPQAVEMYREKLFPRGRHNDGRFVHLGMTDWAFTGRIVERFRRQLSELPASVEQVITLQHHPPVRPLFYPSALRTPEQLFWLAYTGNRRMQRTILDDPRIQWVVCGHTHAACEAVLLGKRCLNVGGDYPWKRLVLIDTDTGRVDHWEFGRTAAV